MITVVVGKPAERKTYFVHKDLLSTHSGYFKACLSSNAAWKEGEEKKVVLAEDNPGAFGTIVSWLYKESEALNIFNCAKNASNDVREPYKLADKLLMPAFKNDLMDKLRQQLLVEGLVVGPSHIKTIRDAGLAHSTLYNLSLRQCAWTMCNLPNIFSNLEGEQKPLKTDADVAQACLLAVQSCLVEKWIDPRLEIGCVYHDHSDGSKCEQ